MTEQMTEAGAFLLVAAIAVFWITVAVAVRTHAQRRRARGGTDAPRPGITHSGATR